MKKLIAMYLGIMLVREVAKYYKINSFEDVMKLVLPSLENILPQRSSASNNTSNSSGNNNNAVKTNKSRELTHA
jgi:hypothetical protein